MEGEGQEIHSATTTSIEDGRRAAGSASAFENERARAAVASASVEDFGSAAASSSSSSSIRGVGSAVFLIDLHLREVSLRLREAEPPEGLQGRLGMRLHERIGK